MWCAKPLFPTNTVTIKDTQKEKTPPKKTQALTKNMNIDIWIVGTLSQLFIRGSYIQVKN